MEKMLKGKVSGKDSETKDTTIHVIKTPTPNRINKVEKTNGY